MQLWLVSAFVIKSRFVLALEQVVGYSFAFQSGLTNY